MISHNNWINCLQLFYMFYIHRLNLWWCTKAVSRSRYLQNTSSHSYSFFFFLTSCIIIWGFFRSLLMKVLFRWRVCLNPLLNTVKPCLVTFSNTFGTMRQCVECDQDRLSTSNTKRFWLMSWVSLNNLQFITLSLNWSEIW